MIELAKARRNYVVTEQFYVAIELARVGRIYVTIEDFYVVTDQTRRAQQALGAHATGELCCYRLG